MKRLLLEQAEANRYINQLWLQTFMDLPVADLEQPQGAFFDSIFGTLNHILLADRIWVGRITQNPYPFEKLSDRQCEDMKTFKTERTKLDDVLSAMVSKEQDFTRDIVYKNSAGEKFSQPIYQALLHLFAHQHHHRGQVAQMCHEQNIELPDGGMLIYYRAVES